MKQITKLVLAVLLLLCLADMPYGYYILVRFVATFAFAYMAYGYYRENKEGFAFLFGALALMFQPFIKLALGRMLWNVVDVVVVAGLLYLVYSDFRKSK